MSAAAVPVHFELDGALGRITLARASAHNALDTATIDALERAVGECERASGLRAVLICAEGRNFTVGGDLVEFESRREDLPQLLAAMIEPLHAALARIAELPVPVVCAAHGAVAGGGLGLLWCADIVVAADDLKLAPAFARLGLSGDGGSSWYLPRLIGVRRALELILENRTLDADEALALGLVTRVTLRERLREEAERTANALASGPTVALGQMRALLRASAGRTLREGLAAELDAMLLTGASADAARGIAAFAARETPVFDGA